MSGMNDGSPDGPTPPLPVDDPDDRRGLRLHRRLVENETDAPTELFNRYYQPLFRLVAGQIHDRTHRDDVANDIVADALLKLLERPARFDPSRGKSLFNYLRMDVQGDVMNYIQRVRKLPTIDRLDRPLGEDDGGVGNGTVGGNIASDDLTPEQIAEMEADRLWLADIRARVVESDEDGIVFDLQYIDGVRRTEDFAAVLGIGHLPAGPQATEVQRIKDRVSKRLRRIRKEGLLR